MSVHKELNALHAQLSAEYKKGFPDIKSCGDLLEKLKVKFWLFIFDLFHIFH